MIDLWPRLEPLLARVERPARYLDHEWGSTRKEGADFNYCMVYPDTYELGQPNQAVRILVNAVNATEHLAAERAFLPAVDLIDLMREEGVPMFSLESCAPLSGFDAIGITLPHELAATNVLEVLDLSGIPVRAVRTIRSCSAAGPASLTPSLMRRSSTRCLSAKARSRCPRRCSACASAVVRVLLARISCARSRRFPGATFPRCIA